MRFAQRTRHAARRLFQTARTFDNPGAIMVRMALTNATRKRRDVVFRIGHFRIVAPAARGAIFPIYEVFAEDTYRLAWFTQGLRPDAKALDVGAHVGSFSVAFTRARPGGRVWAYEASPRTAAYLTRTIEASAADGHIVGCPEALAAASGTIELGELGDCSPLNTVRRRSVGTTVIVPCITIETAFARAGAPVDLVKIDAEGVEYELILESDPRLWRSVSRVVLEYHDVPGHGRHELIEHLAVLGLDVVAHEPMQGNPREGLLWFSRHPSPLDVNN